VRCGNLHVGEDFSPPALPRRKGNRLPPQVYRQGGSFFLTTTVRNRRQAFSDPDAATCCLSALREVATKLNVEIDTYCLMPDHVHLLVMACEGIDVAEFMYRFKQASGFECNRQLAWRGPFWQASYYDHVVRRSEDIESVRAYVLANPVRAGIVENPEEYPFAGCLVIERED